MWEGARVTFSSCFLPALGRVSQLSLPSSIGSSQDFDVETSSVNSAQLGGDDTASMGSGKSTEAQPKYCTVLYNYSVRSRVRWR